MLRIFLSLIGVAAMIGFYFFMRWATTLPGHFGEGFGIGVIFATFMFWLCGKVAPESFSRRR